VKLQSGGIAVDTEVSLAPRHPKDAADMYAIVERHRPELRTWLTWIDATRTSGDALRYAQYAQAQFESHVAFDYAIREHGVLVGSIGVHGIDWSSRHAEIGYWLSPEARGRGIITRACRALTTHAVARLDLHRLEIRCVTENARSRAVPERLGYRFEGTLAEAYYLHGSFRDIALYATTATLWRSR
jgi:ribosomal-protein-serine acetyltransferase